MQTAERSRRRAAERAGGESGTSRWAGSSPARSARKPAELRRRYGEAFMEALAVRTTPRRRGNVLQHASAPKDRLDPDARAALAAHVADYQKGLVSLGVPVTRIRHYVERLGIEYLAGQIYLEPHPKERMLRNHV